MNETGLFLQKALGSFIRHSLTVGAGYLVAKGVVDSQTATTLSAEIANVAPGVILWGASQVWSLFKAKKEAKKEVVLKNLQQ